MVRPTEYTLRSGTPADFDAVVELLSESFHETYDAEGIELERLVFEPERTALAWAGDRLVGCSGSFTRDLTVPGGIVPSAHVTIVSVDATHRRHGLLNRMMAQLFADALRLGEPVAHLPGREPAGAGGRPRGAVAGTAGRSGR